MIREVDFEYIKKFFRPFPSNIFVLPKYEHFFVLFDEDIPMSMIGMHKEKAVCLYTLPKYQGHGYATELVKFLIDKYRHLHVLANMNSHEIFKKAGFTDIKQYDKVKSKGKHYSLWRMEI